MSVIRHVSDMINCGYARANIYDNSPTQRGCNGRENIDIMERARKFRSQFNDCRDYGIPEGYFEPRGKDGTSQFDRDCSKILNGFTTLKWPRSTDKEAYLAKFSTKNWSELPTAEKGTHTMSKCVRCYENAREHQESFPLKPLYQAQPVLVFDRCALKRQGTKKFTCNALAELNSVYRDETNTTFRDALLKDKSLGLENKKAYMKGGKKGEKCKQNLQNK